MKYRLNRGQSPTHTQIESEDKSEWPNSTTLRKVHCLMFLHIASCTLVDSHQGSNSPTNTNWILRIHVCHESWPHLYYEIGTIGEEEHMSLILNFLLHIFFLLNEPPVAARTGKPEHATKESSRNFPLLSNLPNFQFLIACLVPSQNPAKQAVATKRGKPRYATKPKNKSLDKIT